MSDVFLHLYPFQGNIFLMCIISGKPRSSVSNIGDVNVLHGSISATTDPFQVTAYPGPLFFLFGFLGKLENATTTLPLPEGITMSGTCVQLNQVYRHQCQVMVGNVSRVDQTGFYNANVTNTQGAAILRFQVTYNGQY
jgi:hypothetical protein